MFWSITLGDVIGYVLTIIIAVVAVSKIINKDNSLTKTRQSNISAGGDVVGRDKNVK